MKKSYNIKNGRIYKILKSINCFFYLLFIAFIPVTFLDWGGERSYTFVLPFFISLIGLFVCFFYLLIYERHRLFDSKIISLIIVFFILAIQSLIFSFTLDLEYKNSFFGISPVYTGIKETIYVGHSIALLIYSFLELQIIERKKIVIPFLIGFSFFVLFGIVQVLYITGFTFFGKIIDFLNKIKLMHNSEYFATYGRPCASTPEAAHMTQIIFCYLIPFSLLLYKNIKKVYLHIIFIIYYIMLIPIILLSSSAELVGTAIFFGIFIVARIIIKSIRSGNKIMPFIAIALSSIILIVIFLTPLFQRVIVEKIFGTNAYSTQKRMSHVYNALIVFFKNPGFGVGSGLSGYFYKENICNTWFMNSSEVRSIIIGEYSGIPTASPFIFYFLSSYGIFGTSLFAWSIINLVRDKYRLIDKHNLNICVLGLVMFAFISLFVENIIANYYIGFLLSLPILFIEKKHVIAYSISTINI